MVVQVINSYEAFQEVINSRIPIVIDFWAEWCAPCKAVAPIFEKLSSTAEPDVQFYKVNIDEQAQIAAELNISSIPNFKLFKDGKIVWNVVGVNPPKLEELVTKGKSLVGVEVN